MNRRRLGGPLLLVPRIVKAVWRRILNHLATKKHRLTIGSMGPGSKIMHSVRFMEPKQVSIGANCLVWTGVGTTADDDCAVLTLRDKVQINVNVMIDVTGPLSIGENTLISEEAVIYTHDHGLDPKSKPKVYGKEIGANVWIGMRAIILPKCKRIGDWAVIGAGAVVSRNVPNGAIVVGSPAKIVGFREGFSGQAESGTPTVGPLPAPIEAKSSKLEKHRNTHR